ncbi:MAG: isoprenylcysteine carboxylmethyltransferase family protein [Desulfobacterales bacterium]
MDSAIIMLSKFVLLATYLIQAIQIFGIKVPSAGSTVEMLTRARVDRDVYRNHPAGQYLESKLKVAVMTTATAITTLVFVLPLIVELFPSVTGFLLLLSPRPRSSFRLAAVIFLVTGNLVSTAAACTLKNHVTFYEFGETRDLYTGGIYRFVRNPLSTGLAFVYAGFFCYLPSVEMAVGFCVVMLNNRMRIGMEEIYLERTFGDRYRRYRQVTGKYFPKFSS